ncbi:MAG: PHP-associated domain-containing protein, partial [Oscillospiraceae bacterium]
CVACHPFRNNNRGLEEKLLTVKGLGGVEVLNGSTDPAANKKAFDYCKKINAQIIGVSDAHIEENIGKYVTYIDGDIKTLEEFVEALKSRKTKVAIWNKDHYAIIDKL